MVLHMLLQSLLSGLATLVGALLVVLLGHPNQKVLAMLLGFAGGVMTSVVVCDLIPSAFKYGNLLTTCSGFMAGLILMLALDLIISLLPRLQENLLPGNKARMLKMGTLIATGIALHDLPEGMAIAVGYSAQEALGLSIALAIGLHNIPEGMATAAPLTMAGVSAKAILLTCFVISLFTPLGACLGQFLVSLSSLFISLLLALAGGAMTFIVKSELLPESRRHHPHYGLLGFFMGGLLILALGLLHT